MQKANAEFLRLEKSLEKKGLQPPEFEFISRKGFLQNNIDDLATQKSRISTIFVGKRMLDYRLSEVKDLHTPLYFIE